MHIERTATVQSEGAETGKKSLSKLAASPAIALLGEPGMGKSTEFRRAADLDADAVFATVRDFLSRSADSFRGKTVFLDGLDELRAAESDGLSVVDRLIDRLAELGNPKFRLSCRSSDWYGELDVSRLAASSQSTTVEVLLLDPLTREQTAALIEDSGQNSADFMANAMQYGIEGMLENPQTLGMLIDAVAQSSRWPTSRLQVFELAIQKLLRETSVARELGALDRSLSTEHLTHLAETLCAHAILSGVAGFARQEADATVAFPFIGEIDESPIELRLVSERRLFSSDANRKFYVAHRTLAEYMTAKHLCRKVDKGFSRRRLLALISGSDGGIPADLRGTAGWLATLSPDMRGHLTAADPLGIVLYGDPAQLSSEEKLNTVRGFEELSQSDPWSFGRARNSAALSGLVDDETLDPIVGVVERSDTKPALGALLLRSIRHSKQGSKIGPRLISFVENDALSEVVRHEALDALLAPDDADLEAAMALLEKIQSGAITDDDQEMRGMLIARLYKDGLSANDIAQYLLSRRESTFGAMYSFRERELRQKSSSEDFRKIADELWRLVREESVSRDGFEYRYEAVVLEEVLSSHDSTIPPERLFRWLSIGLDQYDHCRLPRSTKSFVNDWLSQHPQVVQDVFCVGLRLLDPAAPWMGFYQMQELFAGFSLPKDSAEWLLEEAVRASVPKIKEELFIVAFRRVSDGTDWSGSLDRLEQWTSAHPDFSSVFDACRAPAPVPHEEFHAQAREQRDAQRRETRENDRANLHARIDGIRSSDDLAALHHLAEIFIGRRRDPSIKSEGLSALEETYDVEISRAAVDGFAKLTERTDLPSVRDMLSTHDDNRFHPSTIVAIAATILACDRGEVSEVQGATVERATVGALLQLVSTNSDWFRILAEQHGEVVASALTTVVDHQLRSGDESPHGLHELLHTKALEPFRGEAATGLVKSYPSMAPEPLRRLAAAAMAEGHSGEIRVVGDAILAGGKPLPREIRALWLTVKATTHSSTTDDLRKFVGRELRSAWSAAKTFEEFRAQAPKDSAPTVHQFYVLIDALGAAFYPADHPRGVVTHGDQNDFNGADLIRDWLSQVQSSDSPEASALLTRLRDSRRLAKWKNYFSHALAEHSRARRDLEFRFPSLREIARMFASGEPISVSDLHAVVVDELDSIRESAERGFNDGFVEFWNVGSKGQPTTPRTEGRCRDTVLRDLRTRVIKLGIRVDREVSYRLETRADIDAGTANVRIPVEAKRHYNRELWTAPADQLITKYASDPQADGFGVYLVFWFGEAPKRRMPAPPKGIARPSSPSELEARLRESLPEAYAQKIAVFVVDVSAPRRPPRNKK